MARVDVFNKARSEDIENRSIVGASVTESGDLIFVTGNGTQINAGNIKGPQGAPGPSGGVYPGMIMAYAGSLSTIPEGYLYCDGRSFLRSSYTALYNVIGTRFGSGTGSDTFQIPDLKNRVLVGTPGVDEVRGFAFGSDTVELTEAQLPPHSHTTGNEFLPGFVITDRPGTFGKRSGSTHAAGTPWVPTLIDSENLVMIPNTGETGSGEAFSVAQPSLMINYLIKFSNV